VSFLQSLFLRPVAIYEKIFAPALAFIANQFAIFCDDIPFPVTVCTNHTNHFSLRGSTAHGMIKRAASTGLAYTLFVRGWQEKKKIY
jgi:hypothetical protein